MYHENPNKQTNEPNVLEEDKDRKLPLSGIISVLISHEMISPAVLNH